MVHTQKKTERANEFPTGGRVWAAGHACPLQELGHGSFQLPRGSQQETTKTYKGAKKRQSIIKELLKLWAGLRENEKDGEGPRLADCSDH